MILINDLLGYHKSDPVLWGFQVQIWNRRYYSGCWTSAASKNPDSQDPEINLGFILNLILNVFIFEPCKKTMYIVLI